MSVAPPREPGRVAPMRPEVVHISSLMSRVIPRVGAQRPQAGISVPVLRLRSGRAAGSGPSPAALPPSGKAFPSPLPCSPGFLGRTEEKTAGLLLTCPQPLLSPLLPPRFKSLQGHLAARRLQLQASVTLYRFYQVSNTELTWVADHMPSAGSTSHSKCSDGARSLLRKHEARAPFSSPNP